jgi:hypothetical protein
MQGWNCLRLLTLAELYDLDLLQLASLPSLNWNTDREHVNSPMELIEQRPGSSRALFLPEPDAMRMSLSPYRGIQPIHTQYEDSGQALRHSRIHDVHLQRRADLLQVDKIKTEISKQGVVLGRATLERALVQPMPDLSEKERSDMFPKSGEGLLIDPFAKRTMSEKGKSSKPRKGKKAKGKRAKK